MKSIFNRTLETTIKKVSIILVIVVGCLIGEIVVDSYFKNSALAFEPFLNDVVAFQNAMVFIVMNGLILSIMVVSTGTGLISTEVHEGTFKLLAAKPNTRVQILFSKLLGAFTGLILLMVLQMLAYYGYVIMFSHGDGNIIAEMVSYLPGYLLYGVIVIFVFLAFSTLLGTIAKKKVTALLPLLAIIIVVFGAIPFYRTVTPLFSQGSKMMPAIVDVNYQFATMLKGCVKYKGEFASTNIISSLTNLYKTISVDVDIARESYVPSAMSVNNDLRIVPVMVGYLLASIAMYGMSFVILKKKDI